MDGVDSRDRLNIRLGKSKRDRRLAKFIQADIERGVNISDLIKQLLDNHYTGAPVPHYSGQGVQEPDEEDRQEALSSKLKGLSFGGLG